MCYFFEDVDFVGKGFVFWLCVRKKLVLIVDIDVMGNEEIIVVGSEWKD